MEFGVWHPVEEGFAMVTTSLVTGSNGTEGFVTDEFEVHGDDPTCELRNVALTMRTVVVEPCRDHTKQRCRELDGLTYHRREGPVSFAESFYRDGCP